MDSVWPGRLRRMEGRSRSREALLSPVHLSLKPISRICSTCELSCASSWPRAACLRLDLRTCAGSPLWAGFQLRPATALLADGRCAGRWTRAGQLPGQRASQGVMHRGRLGLHAVRLEDVRHVSSGRAEHDTALSIIDGLSLHARYRTHALQATVSRQSQLEAYSQRAEIAPEALTR